MNSIRCGGRALDENCLAVGDPCGREFKRSTTGGRMGDFAYDVDDHGTVTGMTWMPLVPVDDATYISEARAAGWAIGPNGEATCPRCRRPDATLVKLCTDLARSTR